MREMLGRSARLILFGLVGCAGCSFEVDPLDFDASIFTNEDLSVPAPDLAFNPDAFTGDGGLVRCSSGVPATHIGEVAERPVARWGAQALPPFAVNPPTTTANADSSRVATGAISVRLDTVTTSAGLFYPALRNAGWDLTPYSTLEVSISAAATDPALDQGWQGPQPHILLVSDKDDYYELVPEGDVVARNDGTFTHLSVPLMGGRGWLRNQFGFPSLFNINYVGLTFAQVTPGFSVWVDDLTFGPGTFLDCSP
jgi:hypothetical protein